MPDAKRTLDVADPKRRTAPSRPPSTPTVRWSGDRESLAAPDSVSADSSDFSEARPRLTYIHQHFRRPDQPGGSRPYEFATRLTSAGWDVTVICAGEEDRTYEVENAQVVQLAVPYRNDMSFGRRILAFVRFSVRATARAATTPADVVFASSTPLTVAVPGLAARFVRRIPLVFEVRDLWPEVPISLGALRNPLMIGAAKCLARTTYRHSAAVVGLSPTMCQGVLRVAPATDVHLIPNTSQPLRFGVTDERRQAVRDALGLCEEDVLLTYAGSLGRSYNPGWLLRLGASAVARANRVRVVVVGQGTQLEELRMLAEDLGLDPKATVPGPLPKSRVAELYAASQAIASCLIDEPSLADNSLNKVFDAYAAGRPLIFNHRGWLATLTESEGAGWGLSTDPDEAATQVIALLDRDQLGAAAACSAALGLSEFNVDHAAESLDRVLRRALGEGPRR